jgi:uncharacterized protein (DUF849 family)
VLINLTTGPGARFAPSNDNPMVAGPGSVMATPEKRVEHVLKLRPDLCSLDIATMTFPSYAFVNLPAHLERMAAMVQSVGVKPELEVFDLGHVRLANNFIQRGIIQGQPLFQLCWEYPDRAGNTRGHDGHGGRAAGECTMGGVWNFEPGVSMVAQLLGGNVRVGLEDNIYLSRGELARAQRAAWNGQ